MLRGVVVQLAARGASDMGGLNSMALNGNFTVMSFLLVLFDFNIKLCDISHYYNALL